MAIINGTNGSDTLNGTAGDDFIFGQGGSDVLAGLGGADFLDGGAGVDTAMSAWRRGRAAAAMPRAIRSPVSRT